MEDKRYLLDDKIKNVNKDAKDMENETIKEKISSKVIKFYDDNIDILGKAKAFRINSIQEIDFIYEKSSKINMYLSEVKIMIITANQIERDSLFSYFLRDSLHHIIKIAKGNLVYSFFKIGENKVVHIEPTNIGSYTHGGAASAVSEAIGIVKPSIILSLGVAYGADYEENEIGDVLVGRQHFSYDKATKVSDKKLSIKKLHIEEPDDYMLCRFKSNVFTEENHRGLFDNSFKVVLGNMVTGEFVVDSIKARNLIFAPFQPFGIIGGEMEAYGIFEEINHKAHCILMKGICDWAAGKNDKFNVKKKVDLGNGYFEEKPYNPKNDFQTLAMLNTCNVCEKFLISKEVFADLPIKGFMKRFWRNMGIIKHHIVKDKF